MYRIAVEQQMTKKKRELRTGKGVCSRRLGKTETFSYCSEYVINGIYLPIVPMYAPAVEKRLCNVLEESQQN